MGGFVPVSWPLKWFHWYLNADSPKGSLVDINHGFPFLQHQSTLRSPDHRYHTYITPIRYHDGRHDSEHCIHYSGRLLGHRRFQVCFTDRDKPVLEAQLCLQMPYRFRCAGRLQDGAGPPEGVQDQPYGQSLHRQPRPPRQG